MPIAKVTVRSTNAAAVETSMRASAPSSRSNERPPESRVTACSVEVSRWFHRRSPTQDGRRTLLSMPNAVATSTIPFVRHRPAHVDVIVRQRHRCASPFEPIVAIVLGPEDQQLRVRHASGRTAGSSQLARYDGPARSDPSVDTEAPNANARV